MRRQAYGSRLATLVLAAFSAGALAGCTGGTKAPHYEIVAGGNAPHGKKVIEQVGCGACHEIPGIYTARGVVGPPLLFWSRRTIIAGELPNTPDNLVRWLKDPKAIEPGTAMPDLGLSDQQARDVAAYLYTLR
jgi:cytochrome c2